MKHTMFKALKNVVLITGQSALADKMCNGWLKPTVLFYKFDLPFLKIKISLLFLFLVFGNTAFSHCIYNNLNVPLQAKATNGSYEATITPGLFNCCSWTNTSCNPTGNISAVLEMTITVEDRDFETRILVQAGGYIEVDFHQEVAGFPPQIVCSSFTSNDQLLQSKPFVSSSGQTRNIKFVATGDPQVDVNNQVEINRASNVLNGMKQTLNNNTDYRGMIIAGDLTENSNEDELDLYLNFINGFQHVTYDGTGNHDLYNPTSAQRTACANGNGGCIDPVKIINEVKNRNRSTAVNFTNIPGQIWAYNSPSDQTLGWESIIPPHYSWDWGDVHFVQLNLYPGSGNGMLKQVNNVNYYLTPLKSLDFLISDLSNKVGNSCRPVVLIYHFPQSVNLWASAEKMALWNAIANYNIALLIVGHRHVETNNWKREWNRPSGTTLGPSSITEVVAGGAIAGGYYIDVQITNNNLNVKRWKWEEDNEFDLFAQFNKTISGPDDDNDGVPNACDTCPGFNDNEDFDNDNIADGCDPDDDNDGTNDLSDCEPLNNTLPAIPGTTCDDGNANTTNDVILADGCTCEGSSGGNCTASFTANQGSIVVSGLTAPINYVKIYNAAFNLIYQCGFDCNTTETVPLSNGTYFVSITQWDQVWNTLCTVEDYVEVNNGGSCQGNPCDDNDPCTSNDLLDANCNCSGTPNPDNDNDGFCANLDCDDNNNTIPTSPGTSCNDNNPNTNNDVILADGCTCEGTSTNGCSATFSGVNGAILVDGLNAPINYVKIYDGNFNMVYQCDFDCNPSETVSLPNGTYFVSITQWNQFWNTLCTVEDYVDVNGNGGCQGQPCNDNNECTSNDIFNSNCDCAGTPLPDNDNDGFCSVQDCDDNNPSLPTTPGSPCNDNNPNTTNDIIQSDGCTCQGNISGGCTASFSAASGAIIVTGMTAPNQMLYIFDNTWQTIFFCDFTCQPTQTVHLNDGTYYVKVQQWTAGWQPLCTVEDFVTVGGGSGCQPGQPCNDSDPCTVNDVYSANCNCQGTYSGDGDNDGICTNQDCDDSNPLLPASPGTTCNDNNPNTNNDVILADGCTCQGTSTGGGNCNINVAISNDVITIGGYREPVAIIKVFNNSWQIVFECVGNCSNPTQVSGLPNGLYHIDIQLYTAVWNPVCTELVDVQIVNSTFIQSVEDSPILRFDVYKDQAQIQMNWVINNDYKTDGFEIEHAIDGVNFEVIQIIESISDSEFPISYQSRDDAPNNGINFYRITQILENENFVYSEIKPVNFEKASDFSVFPNPAENQLFVRLPARMANTKLGFYNNLGQLLKTKSILSGAPTIFNFDLQEFPSGVYLMSITPENGKRVTELVVVNKQ